MKKFSLFKKEQESIVRPEYELSIPIRDLKEHMVHEFDRARSLVEENRMKDELIEQFREDELKHKASMVLVDEYRNRLDIQANEFESLKEKYDKQLELRRSVEEEKNTLIIRQDIMQGKLDNVDSHIESVSKDKVERFCEDLINEVKLSLSLVKGNVSKSKFQEILNDSIVKGEIK